MMPDRLRVAVGMKLLNWAPRGMGRAVIVATVKPSSFPVTAAMLLEEGKESSTALMPVRGPLPGQPADPRIRVLDLTYLVGGIMRNPTGGSQGRHAV